MHFEDQFLFEGLAGAKWLAERPRFALHTQGALGFSLGEMARTRGPLPLDRGTTRRAIGCERSVTAVRKWCVRRTTPFTRTTTNWPRAEVCRVSAPSAPVNLRLRTRNSRYDNPARKSISTRTPTGKTFSLLASDTPPKQKQVARNHRHRGAAAPMLRA